MTSCHDSGDRLSVQRRRGGMARERATWTRPKYSYDCWPKAYILCDLQPSSLLSLKGRAHLERSMSERQLFSMSHASPEDNAFTIWLGAKLAAAGYEVWADVLRLTGGDDWQRKLEDALRNRACKVLLAANQKSVEKQGVRNEIQIASDVAKKRSATKVHYSPQARSVRLRLSLSRMPNTSISVMAGLPACMNC